MESINAVIDDEIRAHSKGEISQSTLETLPSLTGNLSETSSATVEPVSIPPISPTAADVLPDSTDVVPTEETDPTSDEDSEQINPLIEPLSWVKLNHSSRQLLGNLNEGRQLRS
jgi:hypothetical protein